MHQPLIVSGNRTKVFTGCALNTIRFWLLKPSVFGYAKVAFAYYFWRFLLTPDKLTCLERATAAAAAAATLLAVAKQANINSNIEA